MLKLAEELHTWDDPLARELEQNLQPLTDLIVQSYIDFLPKLKYPIRVGEHTNSAFGFSFAWDYANTTKHEKLKIAIEFKAKDFKIKVGEVSDRTDGKLVHLDGLNFSRAWVLYGLANQYPEYSHLINIANEHVRYSLPNLVNDSYEGGHWLSSFAIYALDNNPG